MALGQDPFIRHVFRRDQQIFDGVVVPPENGAAA
jgi:hypothetical protein